MVSDRLIAGSSSGNPPACHTPRFTSSARARKCTWHGFASDHVLTIPTTGLPAKSEPSYPICSRRERCPKARRFSAPSQRWLRSSSGRLGTRVWVTSLRSAPLEVVEAGRGLCLRADLVQRRARRDEVGIGPQLDQRGFVCRQRA